MKLIVIGGVAGGASAAARARRLDENAEIILFERGKYISFANCGLPYHVGKVIQDRESLMVMTPEKFLNRTNINVRVEQEIAAINRDRKTVSVRNLADGSEYEESYDKLIISTGSSPVIPPVPGVDDKDVFRLWTIPDMDKIIDKISTGVKRALVVGAGFIGLEIAENLRMRDLEVTVVELLPQVLPTLDQEMSVPLRYELEKHGVNVILGQKVTAFSRDASSGRLAAALDNGAELFADFVVMSVGVRPNSELAKAAGLELNSRGGIVVDEKLRTSDENIYAVGDVIQVKDPVFGGDTMIPLAGPANRQGRIAAENVCGRNTVYKGTLGTSVVKVGDLTAASTGWTERRLKQAEHDYQKVYLHPSSNASYYPGCGPLNIKMLFDKSGNILGAQVVGNKGVDKRIDVFATAMRGGQNVYDLEELELAYAPPYGSAKDPINFAGMVAANILRGDTTPVYCDAIPKDALLLDIREPAETELGIIEGATIIPLGKLRERLNELPKDRVIVTYCKVGLRGYLAERILKQHGYNATNLIGGIVTWKLFHPERSDINSGTNSNCCAYSAKPASPVLPDDIKPDKDIDVSAMQCPGPVVRLKQELEDMANGQVLKLKANASFQTDLESWTVATGNTVLSIVPDGSTIQALIRKGTAGSGPIEAVGGAAAVKDGATVVLFSNDLDKAMAAFIIASGLATTGAKVTMFFTFWGLSVLRKENPPAVGKDILSRMFGWMLPKGARKLALSKMNMLGMGTGMMKYVMNKKNVAPLPELIANARKLGIRFVACDMAMDVMGLTRSELIEDIDEVAGVARFAALTREGGNTIFI